MTKKQDPKINLPIKGKPYSHQVEAFNFTCKIFGLDEGGDEIMSKEEAESRGVALLME